MSSWDNDGNGVIDINDVLGGYDSNKDGVLDTTELQTFVKQLSYQLGYNNTLLAQIHELETLQLSNRRELQLKSDQLKESESAKQELLNENRYVAIS